MDHPRVCIRQRLADCDYDMPDSQQMVPLSFLLGQMAEKYRMCKLCRKNGEIQPNSEFQMRWKILFYRIPQFIYESKSERIIIEIGPHLPKLS